MQPHLAHYPNPLQFEATITLEFSRTEQVHVAVYDMLGREMAVVVDGVQPADRHGVQFDARSLPSGVYLYRMRAGQRWLSRPMTIVS